VAGRSGRSERVSQVFFDISALHAQLARKPRDRSWLIAEQRQEIFPKHAANLTAALQLALQVLCTFA
jgi:hypothetical protein